jgi:hypothetical protein
VKKCCFSRAITLFAKKLTVAHQFAGIAVFQTRPDFFASPIGAP